ncbi:MAG: TusE/DsrC/DsvC family sulfur relay protein [Gammaproteobacteria bacterium]|nr:TusE/DsrC/DsvC family sulfur relay protein [Gammaproteobacteria bacterium]
MANSWDDIPGQPGRVRRDAAFPNAPEGWKRAVADRVAADEGLELSDDHWRAIRAIQEYFAKNDLPRVRELHDALGELFHAEGGIRYLYLLFPGGPVAQGCRLAGLKAPPGTTDKSFGSVG